ncbi:MAG: murein biosynthesis integral membrane protein MurJ [Anaerolineae bacterium]|nr:murein biosynthesis integral membrane protein MurJ [Anaerolineae bacterium]
MSAEPAPALPPVDRRGIAGAAALLSVGNVSSRLLGLARETFIANLFGAEGPVSAFRVASRTYNLLYELMVGGIVASALVPVLSEYAERDRLEFRRVLTSLSAALTVMVGICVVALELAAPAVTQIMGTGYGPELQSLIIAMLRLVLPAVLLTSLAGLLSAALYSLKRFLFPSFMAALFNLSLIGCGALLARQYHVRALALGVLVGAAAQLALQLAGVWRAGIRPTRCLYHPALKRIAILALPVLGSLLVGQAQVVIDTNLASRTGDQSVAWMANATTLIQFPLGLVAMAVSVASLPELSRLAALADGRAPFAATLSFALRLVVILMLPATAALAALGLPVIRLLFEHGSFTPRDAAAVHGALGLYLLGLPAAAVDQVFILAFYARGDTWRPAAVGVAAVGIYLAVALATMRDMGMLGLVLANSCQWVTHAGLMAWLTHHRIAPLRGHGLGRAAAQAGLGSALAALAMAAALRATEHLVPLSLAGEITSVLVPGLAGVAVYVATLRAGRSPEYTALAALIQGRLRRIWGTGQTEVGR